MAVKIKSTPFKYLLFSFFISLFPGEKLLWFQGQLDPEKTAYTRKDACDIIERSETGLIILPLVTRHFKLKTKLNLKIFVCITLFSVPQSLVSVFYCSSADTSKDLTLNWNRSS